MKKVIMLLSICAFVVTSCAFVSSGNAIKIEAAKNITTVDHKVADFSKVSIAISCDVEYLLTEGDSYVKIQAPENIQEHIIAEVKNGTLELRKENGYEWNHADIDVVVASKSLSNVTIAGSADFSTDCPIVADDFECVIAGSGEVDFESLKASSLKISIAGSGEMDFDGLDCGCLDLSIAGSGDVVLAGKADSAEISIAGSGDVDAKGLECVDFKSKIAGSGSVKR